MNQTPAFNFFRFKNLCVWVVK